ncbi:type II toxin-antitoxin system PemK/MazF family toxin [Desulfotomaculum sp. 1211_IL3151]|uniref:type II toxin-antitoxin system PemK/MazF family toxin n=1 Tax=Desulfotomaculum sp. 1211_IL3151 TaxID=3084055 RepID=UPI002FD93E4B
MFQQHEITPPYRPLQLYDIREFQVGEVYYIKDELIGIPNIDRTTIDRNIHLGRRVVIAHNSQLNTNPTWPLVHIAPLSHRVDLMRETDIEVTIKPEDGNGVAVNSLIQLALVQPVLKVDLERRIGALSREKIAEMIALQEDMLLGQLDSLDE